MLPYLVCNAISHDRCLMESRKMSCTVKSGGYRPLNFISNNKIKDPLTAAVKTGHEFKVKSYYKPTYCHHCSELLWGLMNQGYQCTGKIMFLMCRFKFKVFQI